MNNITEQFIGFYNSQYLFNKPIKQYKLFDFESLELNTIDFSHLNIYTQIPLGKRIEHFFDFYIQHSKRYKSLHKNIQIIHNKTTLGELDFILQDTKTNKIIHLELVYKFYIYDPSFLDELDRYIGPNKNDSLVKKVNKLETKQFPLLYNEYTKDVIPDVDIQSIEQQIAYFGQIFVPKSFLNSNIPLIKSKSIVGFYISKNEFNKKNYETNLYYLPHRYDWISPIENNKQWLSYNEIVREVDLFINLKKSPLVWMKNSNNQYEKFFIIWWK